MFEAGTVVLTKTVGRLGEDSRTYCVQQLCAYLNRGQ